MKNEQVVALAAYFKALAEEIRCGDAVREHGSANNRKEQYQAAGKALIRAIERCVEVFK